ncbi:MAG: hypothetical protein AAF195_04545, partial [Pseudomonadota bacterium]
MLRIKYFEEFKNGQPFIVVISDREGLKSANEFFKTKKGAFLNDSKITEFSDITKLNNNSLYLNPKECQEIAQHFNDLYNINEARHVYFDIEALGNEIEVIISYLEYN